MKYFGVTLPTTPISPILHFLKPRPRMTDKKGRKGQRQKQTRDGLHSDPQTFPHKMTHPLGHFIHLASAEADSLGVPLFDAKPPEPFTPLVREEDRTEHITDITVPTGRMWYPDQLSPPKDTKLPMASLLCLPSQSHLTSLPSTCLWV